MEKVTLTHLSNDELSELILTSVIKALGLISANTKPEENYFNVTQAVGFLKIPKSTLYSYTSKRLIPYYKRGKRLVFKQSDLEAWLSESKKRTVSEIEAEAHCFQIKKRR